MAAAGVMERVSAALAAGDYGAVCGLLDEAELEALAPWGPEGGGAGGGGADGAAAGAAAADGGAAAAAGTAAWPAALHLLSHVYAGNLADARLLLKRMPEGVRADPQVAAAARLLQCAWQGSGEGVWRALRGHPWSGPAGQLAEALGERLRARQLDLVAAAYSHISAARLAALCGCSEADALACATGRGWRPAAAAADASGAAGGAAEGLAVIEVVPPPSGRGQLDTLAALEQLSVVMMQLE
ncbi:hypothetical protein HYH02_012231 [Chlamydomonas schloesseri]|uniref:CSN8/PSMD8/EIF3K domain-containing protein n=1 Tax=Chlamydomonas schloesseri TaxID=2026947 RepID=A0A835T8W6_9CHLO|nr:hypothetical protein HYH02_012231 [Chlamydomonas schloesseri]|eukprot:KAG2434565.1 hypothetical protein HYH02_012231 [Chlamydomonas schloesseri]